MDFEDIRTVAVIGAGIMGHAIAQVFARGGYKVNLLDVDQERLDKALVAIRLNLELLARVGIGTKDESDRIVSNITTTLDLEQACAGADFVEEAVTENMELKKEIFRNLEAACPDHAVFASNTSTQRISEIASAVSRPEKVIGMHWMLTPYIRPLVEITPGEKTAPETVRLVKRLAESLGKVPVVAPDKPGFIVNRLQAGVFKEALALLEEGVSIEDIDSVWTRHLGLRYCMMGPFAGMDQMGLDTLYLASLYLAAVFEDESWKPTPALGKLFEDGEYGLKTGKGFYDYAGQDVDVLLRQRDQELIELMRHKGMQVG